jgi:hypothetical protein
MLDAPLPDLILYGRPGCGLCDEARQIVTDLLHARSVAGLKTPALVERDIETDPAWERAFLTTIPVVELSGRRVELAVSAGVVERLLSAVLDA